MSATATPILYSTTQSPPGRSRANLAGREAGVSMETINAIEHGRRQPTVTTLDKLARALDVEVKDFFS